MDEKKTAPEVEAPRRMEELKELATPLVRFLQDNYHPHAAIIIRDDFACVVEELIGVPFQAKN